MVRNIVIKDYVSKGKPARTQRSEEVPLWPYFGQDVPGHNRTKIGRTRFLTYFASAISGQHVASGNTEKFP